MNTPRGDLFPLVAVAKLHDALTVRFGKQWVSGDLSETALTAAVVGDRIIDDDEYVAMCCDTVRDYLQAGRRAGLTRWSGTWLSIVRSHGKVELRLPTDSDTEERWALSSELVTPHLTWDDSLLDAYLEARRHVQEAVLAAAPSQKVTSFSVEEGRIAFGDREFACVCAAGSSKEGNVVLLRFPTAGSVPNELAWLSAAEPRWRKLSVSRPTLRLMGQHGVAVTRAMANVLVATIGAVCFGSRFRGIFRLGYRGAVAYLILVDSGE